MSKQLKYDFRLLFLRKRLLYLIITFLVINLSLLVGKFGFSEICVFNIGKQYQAIFLLDTGGSRTTVLFFIYFLPLIVAIIHADIYLIEKKMLYKIFIRNNSSKVNYYLSKVIVSFASGFILIGLFLILNYLCLTIILNGSSNNHWLNVKHVENSWQSINTLFTFPSIFFNAPSVNVLIYIAIITVYAGILSLISFIISLFSNKKVTVYIGCFLLSLVPMVILSFFNEPYNNYYWQAIIDMELKLYNPTLIILIWLSFIISGTFISVIYKVRSEDT